MYVLYRGFHYTPDQTIPARNTLDDTVGKDCKAPYTHFANIYSAASLASSKSLQNLKESGRVLVDNQSYPSLYDWMQEYYVNEYTKFKNELRQANSRLNYCLATQCQLTPNNVFLISTSLNPNTAIKYASGIFFPLEHRRTPLFPSENTVLGHLDIFVIPVREIAKYYPYFVVEEFARHHITIPHRFTMKNYTLAEEVNFPFYLPGHFHVGRVAIDIADNSQFRIPPRNRTRWGCDDWMREQIQRYADVVDKRVMSYLKTNRKTRVYLGPLTYQLEKRAYHLEPSQAVILRRKIEDQINAFGRLFFEPTTQRVDINGQVDLNFVTAYALQNLGYRGYPMEIDMPFSLDSEATKWFSIILEAPGIQRLILEGPNTEGVHDLIEYDEQNIQRGQVPANYFLSEFPFWQSPHTSFYKMLKTLSKRNAPLNIDVTGQSLEPEAYEQLMDIAGVTVEDANRDDDEYYANEWWEDMGMQQEGFGGGFVEDISSDGSKSSDSLDKLAERLEEMRMDNDSD